MTKRARWEPSYSVGNEIIDGQHRDILARCDALADCLAADAEADRKFQELFTELMNLAREHFAAEAALLAGAGYPGLEEHGDERDEFDYLAAEIITTENFDKQELQTFLTLWWTGHIVGAATKYRSYLERQPAG